MFLGYSTNSIYIAYCVYNIRTQTVMESTNIFVDDHSDLSEFSKEESINSFTDAAVVESVLGKQVKERIVFIATEIESRQGSGRKSVATETDSQFIITDKK